MKHEIEKGNELKDQNLSNHMQIEVTLTVNEITTQSQIDYNLNSKSVMDDNNDLKYNHSSNLNFHKLSCYFVILLHFIRVSD